MTDRTIKEYISISSEDWTDCINTIATWIVNQIHDTTKRILFQSNFGFMGDDVPCTIYVEQNEEHIFADIVSADWNMFSIEENCLDKIANEWIVNCPSDREDIPNWKELSAFELWDNLKYRGYCHNEAYDINMEGLIDFIFEELRDNYDTRNYFKDRPNYTYQANMAIIGKESVKKECEKDD